MSKKEKVDIDEEMKRISRKSNLNMQKAEISFENRIKKLDKDIDKIVDSKLKDFDESKKLTSDYLTIDYSQDTIDRYREKLKKI